MCSLTIFHYNIYEYMVILMFPYNHQHCITLYHKLNNLHKLNLLILVQPHQNLYKAFSCLQLLHSIYQNLLNISHPVNMCHRNIYHYKNQLYLIQLQYALYTLQLMNPSPNLQIILQFFVLYHISKYQLLHTLFYTVMHYPLNLHMQIFQ